LTLQRKRQKKKKGQAGGEQGCRESKSQKKKAPSLKARKQEDPKRP